MYSNPCAASLSATKPLTTLSVVSVINVIATNTFPFGGVIADNYSFKLIFPIFSLLFPIGIFLLYLLNMKKRVKA